MQTDVTLPQAASKFADEQMEAEEEHPLEVSLFLTMSPQAPDQLASSNCITHLVTRSDAL